MPILLLIGICCATLFFRAADHERMNPWAWSLASVGVTGIGAMRGASTLTLLLMQAALFGLLWWNNVRRQERRTKSGSGE